MVPEEIEAGVRPAAYPALDTALRLALRVFILYRADRKGQGCRSDPSQPDMHLVPYGKPAVVA